MLKMNGLEDEAMDPLENNQTPTEISKDLLVQNQSIENSSNIIQNTNKNNEDSNNFKNDDNVSRQDYENEEYLTDEDSEMDVESKESQEKFNSENANILGINQCSSTDESVTISIERKIFTDSKTVNESKPGDSEMDSDEEDESDEDSTDEDGTVGSDEPQADTVSINSESETSSTTGPENNIKNDKISLDNIDRNGDNTNGTQSPEVQEIDSEKEDKTTAEKSNKTTVQDTLRRSSRNVKRMSYEVMQNGNDGSDIEEIYGDPLGGPRDKPIIVNDTKSLIEMAAQQSKPATQKKEPTVVIIDTNSIISGKVPISLMQPKPAPAPQMSAQSLYQSIAARGTTVTPVSSKPLTSIQTTPQPIILPSLTDDMFVVEAPSFIVPYVYEKPSLKPFREFVDILGREVEEKMIKEREEYLKKDKEDRENRNKERRERGEESEKEDESEKEEVEAKEEILVPQEKLEEPVKEKMDKKNRRRGRNEEDDASWDEDSTEDSEEEAISEDDTGTTVVIKDKADDSIDNIKTAIASDLTESKSVGVKTDNYFENALGKFFINIGVNLVQEYVQNDLLKQQKRKLYKESKMGGTNTKPIEIAIKSLSKNLQFSKENNAPYKFRQKKCKFCTFKTESALALEHHLETPHMKNNVYHCNFCSFEIKSPHDILYHMEEKHNSRGRLERAPAYHQCANCPFEDNGKGKLARHLIPCSKKFKPETNLSPPVDWEPPAKIPKIPRSRTNMTTNYNVGFNRAQAPVPITARTPINLATIMPQNNYRPRCRLPMGQSTRGATPQGTPLMRGSVMTRHNSPNPLMTNYPIMPPSISITPLPRAPTPAQSQTQPAKGTFVICEICDGYIKDLEQLRNHMQWIHKVKIHPKMIYNRPPLNCQKCQFRFFTDQGLERHLLGSHGLVTSSMQHAANRGKDAGRCPVCGRVYQWKLLHHVAKDHNLTLKPAHLSYKCTVCTATFGMYKQFENHVYSAHSVVAKRVIDKSKPAKEVSQSKPGKINEEITITPQGGRPNILAKAKKD